MSDETQLVEFTDAEALRDHLDALNDAGIRTEAAGVDVNDNPFLIGLSGPYAESEVVIFGSPWDSEVDYGTGLHCDECHASNLHGINDLRYPVRVIADPEVAR